MSAVTLIVAPVAKSCRPLLIGGLNAGLVRRIRASGDGVYALKASNKIPCSPVSAANNSETHGNIEFGWCRGPSVVRRPWPFMAGSERTAEPVDLVTIKRAAELVGTTPKAIHRKREEGVWLEGREWFRAPDGRIYISIQGYESWVKNGRR